MVDLFDLMTGVGQFLGEVAVVCEEEDAGGVAVEAADGVNAFGGGGADEVEDGSAALGVVGGGDIVLWFI